MFLLPLKSHPLLSLLVIKDVAGIRGRKESIPRKAFQHQRVGSSRNFLQVKLSWTKHKVMHFKESCLHLGHFKGLVQELSCPTLLKIPCHSQPFHSFVLLFLPQTLQVIYPYTPQNDDELELVPGDFIFMSPVEQTSTSEGWIYGISLATGCSGLLPENYITKADECGTWVFHG